jgi:hypothetical protein
MDININIMNDLEDNAIDSSWLDEYEKIAKDYDMFYAENLSFIKIHYIYINDENEIEKIKEETVLLKTPGLLTREDLITVIKSNSVLNFHKYSLLSILKYNLNIEPMHLKNFLKTKNTKAGFQFLHSINHIENIKFNKSITFFHDINELIVLFHQKSLNKHTVCTKRNKQIYITNNKSTRRQQLIKRT